MKRLSVILLLGLVLGSTAPMIYAAAAPDDGDMQETAGPYREANQMMRQMSPKDRRAFMQTIKAKWDKLSADEKKAFKAKVKEPAEKVKARLEQRCQEMRENDGERIYIRFYGMDQLKSSGAKQ